MPTEELYGSYHFLLEIQGVINDNKVIVGGFKSVSGMDSETEIIEFKQGNDLIVRKKPGRTTYSNIVLERGYTETDDLWQLKMERSIVALGPSSSWIRMVRPKLPATTSMKGGQPSGTCQSWTLTVLPWPSRKSKSLSRRLRGPNGIEDRV